MTTDQNRILEQLNWRYATKKFDNNKKLTEEQLFTLTESLRLTPSSFGLEPWKFIIVENQELKKKLKGAAFNQAQVEDCSHLVILCTRTNVDNKYVDSYIARTADAQGVAPRDLTGLSTVIKSYIGVQNINKGLSSLFGNGIDPNMASHTQQAFIALGFLMLSAAMIEVDTCAMGGFDHGQFDKILGLKEKNLTSTVLCTLGFRDETDKNLKRAKVRYGREDVIEIIK